MIGIIEDYISKHNVMALATSCDLIVRNTPVEYIYWNNAFYFLSEGGKKFDGLEVNKNVCLAIFDQMTGGICKGLQVTGIANIIESDTEEYLAYFKHQNISLDIFSKRVPYSIPLIKICVKSFDYFDWDLAKDKYGMRQHLDR